MYTKRIQILNYGPIVGLDITLPIDDNIPKPVVFVGENGAGKSILLSHIVNALISAKDLVYPEVPEVDAGKVFKLRSNDYIRSGADFYFSRVDFEDNLHMGELRSRASKQDLKNVPSGLSGPDANRAWSEMPSDKKDYLFSNIFNDVEKLREFFREDAFNTFLTIGSKNPLG